MPPIDLKVRLNIEDVKIPGLGRALAGIEKSVKATFSQNLFGNIGKVGIASGILKDLSKIPTSVATSQNALRALGNNLRLVFGTSAKSGLEAARILGQAKIAIENVNKAADPKAYRQYRDQIKSLRKDFADLLGETLKPKQAQKAAKDLFGNLVSQGVTKNLNDIKNGIKSATDEAEKSNARLKQSRLEKANATLSFLVNSGQNLQNGESNFQGVLSKELERVRSEAYRERERINSEEEKFKSALNSALDDSASRIAQEQTQKQKELAEAIKQTTTESIRLESVLEKFDQSGGSTNSLNRQKVAGLLQSRNEFIDSGGQSGLPTGSTDPREVARAIRAINEEIGVNIKATNQAGFSIKEFGRQAALAFKRYSAFVIGTSILFRIRAAFAAGTDEALKFEAQVTKVEQVIGGLAKTDLSNISRQIRDTALSLGTDAVDLAKGIQTLAQAGFTDPKGLQNVAKELGKVPLAATFDDIGSTVEGLIAIFGQFNKSLNDTSSILDLVNQYAADFAVESKDIFEGVKRGGATFATAGGSLEQFIQLFSILRSSTRESPETIGTFFKTAFAQLLSPKSQSELKSLGVTSTNLIDQLKELADILPQFSQLQQINIAEELTGERQFSRLTALLREIRDPKVQQQLQKSLNLSSGSVDRSIGARLDDVGQSINRIKAAFADFSKSIIENEGIKNAVKTIADLAQNFATLARNIEPIIPLLTTIAGIISYKIGSVFLKGFKERISPAIKEIISLGLGGNNGIIFGGGGIGGFRSRLNTPKGRKAAFNFAGNSAILATGVASSFFPEDSKFGTGLSGASIGGAIGSIFGPFGIAIGGATGALLALASAARKVRLNVFERNLENAGDNRISRFSVISTGIRSNFFGGLTNPNDVLQAAERRASLASAFTGKPKDILSNVQDIVNEQLDRTVKELLKISASIPTDVNSIEFKSINEISKAISEIDKENISQIAKVLAEGGNLGTTPESSFNLLRFSTLKNEFKQGNLPFSDQQLLELLDNLSKNGLLKTIGLDDLQEQIKQIENRNKIDSETFNINKIRSEIEGIFNQLGIVLNNVQKQIIAQNESLSTIISDPNQIKLVASQNSRRLVKSLSGIDINEIIPVKSIGAKIDQIVQNPDVFRPLVSIANDKGNLDENKVISTRDILGTAFGKDSEITKNLAELFDNLAAISADATDTGTDIIKSLAGFRGTGEDFIKQFTGDIESQLGDSFRSIVDLFNAQIEAQNKVKESIRGLNQELFDLNSTLKDSVQTEQSRRLEGNLFTTRASNFASNTARGRLLLSQAQSSRFASSTSDLDFIKILTGVRNRLLSDTQRINQRAIAGGTLNTEDLNTIRQASDIQQTILDLNQQLAQRLSDVNSRLGLASQATDTLRQAFLDFDSSIQNAGEAISQININDFALGLDALDRFNKGGLNALRTDKDFAALKQVLGIAGDVRIGVGQTGNDIIRQINQELAIPALAAIRSRNTGQPFDQAAEQIKQNFADAAQAAEDARRIEETIRAEQQQLLTAQLGLVDLEKKFYTDQSVSINNLLSPIESINSLLQRFFEGGGLENILKNINNIPPIFEGPTNQLIAGTSASAVPTPLINAIDSFNQGVKTFNDSVASLTNGSINKLEVSPVQVNVALSAPDILQLAGNSIYGAIIQQIAPAIATALGVTSDEAKSVFESGLPQTLIT